MDGTFCQGTDGGQVTEDIAWPDKASQAYWVDSSQREPECERTSETEMAPSMHALKLAIGRASTSAPEPPSFGGLDESHGP